MPSVGMCAACTGPWGAGSHEPEVQSDVTHSGEPSTWAGLTDFGRRLAWCSVARIPKAKCRSSTAVAFRRAATAPAATAPASSLSKHLQQTYAFKVGQMGDDHVLQQGVQKRGIHIDRLPMLQLGGWTTLNLPECSNQFDCIKQALDVFDDGSEPCCPAA